MAFVEFLYLGFSGGFCFTIGGKSYHLSLARNLERNSVEGEPIGGPVDFGSLVVIFDCDGEGHTPVGISPLSLCKVCANNLNTLDFFG
jgi:hypothetical protein